jgi:SAM-dependent methyltransferase
VSEEWGDVLDSWAPTPEHALWRAHSDAINLALLRRWLPEGPLGRVLKTDLFDEAVGTGLVGDLEERAEEVVGIDLAAPVVEAALAPRPGLKGLTADVRSLPFEPASFDLVISNSTLDHFDSVEEIANALDELARVTRPGGMLVITLDNRQNPIVALRTSRAFAGLFRRIGLVPYQLGVTCGHRRLAHLLRSAGFEVRATEAIMHCPPQVAARLSTRFAPNGRPGAEEHLRRVLRFEGLARLPTRYLTSHFVAACAVRLR